MLGEACNIGFVTGTYPGRITSPPIRFLYRRWGFTGKGFGIQRYHFAVRERCCGMETRCALAQPFAFMEKQIMCHKINHPKLKDFIIR
jgi:hypothetical protein